MDNKFPKDFLWGAATSAHQVEGGTHNDWSEWEKANAERLAKEAGKKWEKWQQEKFPEMFDPQNYVSGQACDHYNRYGEDFDLAKAGGHNAHRFSIEWSRIEPKEGKFDEKEIEHYRKVIAALRQRGLEPFVTLWHFTIPVWIRDIGGWENKKTVEFFVRYAKKMVEIFGEEVKFWTTFNEPNIYVGMGYLRGSQPPGKKNPWKAIKVIENFIKAHRQAYATIKTKANVSVGIVVSAIYFDKGNNFLVGWLAGVIGYFWNHWIVKKINSHADFIGLNYYTRWLVNRGEKNNEISDLGWEIYPGGLHYVLKDFKKYKLPLYVTENGIASVDDMKKEKFLKDHIDQAEKAIADGADLRGYFYWSFLEIFEMVEMRGYWTKFGLIEIDYKTLERKPRPSFHAYKKIIKNNGLE